MQGRGLRYAVPRLHPLIYTHAAGRWCFKLSHDTFCSARSCITSGEVIIRYFDNVGISKIGVFFPFKTSILSPEHETERLKNKSFNRRVGRFQNIDARFSIAGMDICIKYRRVSDIGTSDKWDRPTASDCNSNNFISYTGKIRFHSVAAHARIRNANTKSVYLYVSKRLSPEHETKH